MQLVLRNVRLLPAIGINVHYSILYVSNPANTITLKRTYRFIWTIICRTAIPTNNDYLADRRTTRLKPFHQMVDKTYVTFERLSDNPFFFALSQNFSRHFNASLHYCCRIGPITTFNVNFSSTNTKILYYNKI